MPPEIAPITQAPAAHVINTLDPTKPPADPGELREFLLRELEIVTPRVPLLSPASIPLDYLSHAFFEGRRFPPPGGAPHDPPLDSPSNTDTHERAPADCCVWANRGGGKTFLGAVATLLDMIFKPGIEIRILGGSLEQSHRMHEYLTALVDRPRIRGLLSARGVTDKRVRFSSGSRAEILAQSEAAVRGTRVQKVRCDEVELFKSDVWDAIQLTTRSLKLHGPWGPRVRGSIEALSTMHRPMGLMWRIVGDCQGGQEALHMQPAPMVTPTIEGIAIGDGPHDANDPAGDVAGGGGGVDGVVRARPEERVLFRWGVIDVLEHCTDDRPCEPCGLRVECDGRAKLRLASVAGHYHIDDALSAKARVSVSQWRSEMLCGRPSRSDSVYPEFDPAVHVFDSEVAIPTPLPDPNADPLAPSPVVPESIGSPPPTLICGMDFGVRSPAVILWALLGVEGSLRVIDESVVSGEKTGSHVERIVSSRWGRPAWVGIDPAGCAKNEQTLLSAADLLRRSGLEIRAKRIGVHQGVRLVQARLAPALFVVGGGVAGRQSHSGAERGQGLTNSLAEPRVLIHARCIKLIEAMSRYHYDPDRRECIDPVKDGNDHACDALRYMIINIDARAAPGKSYRYT